MRALDTATILNIPLRRLFVALAIAIAALNLGLRGKMLLQHRTELGGVEHNVVYGIQKVMLGRDLYDDPTAPPFDVIQYSPMYYAVCAGMAKTLGIDPLDARSLFLLNRTFALLCNLALVVLVFGLARALGAARWSSILAACFAFSCLWEQAYCRMDALQEVASLAALFVFVRWLATPQDRSLLGCALLAVFGVMTKQSGVVALMVPAVYLLLHRQWRPLLILSAGAAASSLIAVLVLSCFGTLEHGYQHMVLGLANGFSWMMWQDLFAPATYKYFFGWHVLAAIILVRGFRSSDPQIRFLALAIPISLAFALTTGLKYGSRLNYLHESLTLTFIGTAALVGRPLAWRNGVAWSFALYGCLFAMFRTNSAWAWYRVGEPDAVHAAQLENDRAVREVLLNELELQPDEYLFITDRDYLEHFFVGQGLLAQKDIVQYSKGRLFDYSGFHRAMRDGSVRYIITSRPTPSITFLDSTYAGWTPVRTVGGLTILGRGGE